MTENEIETIAKALFREGVGSKAICRQIAERVADALAKK